MPKNPIITDTDSENDLWTYFRTQSVYLLNLDGFHVRWLENSVTEIAKVA